MAAYAKITLASFKQRLKNNEYKSITGARRAIGRMSEWTEDDKNSARRAADKHFGAAKQGTVNKASKASDDAVVVTTASKKAEKAKTKASKKDKPKKAATKKAESKPTPKAKKAESKPKGRRASKKEEEPQSQQSVIEDINTRVGTLHNVLASYQMAKELGEGNVDFVVAAKQAQEALMQIVSEVMTLTNALPPGPEEQAVIERVNKVAAATSAPENHKGNNASVPQPTLPTA